MKRINYYKLLIIPVIILIALFTSFCVPRESQVDSQEVAEEKNREKFSTKEAKQIAKFVTETVASSLAEIRLADAAIEKSRDEEVRNIALHIKNEHAMLLADLTKYAAEKVITVPLTEAQAVRERIQKLEAETEDFNKKWCSEVQRIHKESLERMEKGNEKLSDAALRDWINATLPRLRKNLDLVSACEKRVS